MVSTDRTLLRLHVEAVWDVRLPSSVLNDVELLRGSFQPSWKLCVAELADGRVHIWRPDVSATEREVLRLRVNQALAFPSVVTPIPGVSREVALSLVASPRLDVDMASSIARLLTSWDRPLIEALQPGSLDDCFHSERHPLIGAVIADKLQKPFSESPVPLGQG
jgi:hypothetical protein